MKNNPLKLENQLCFPIYAASNLITRAYQPLLDRLGITYPQYLVLLVLWDTDELTVNEIARRLLLNTNTITPLLKRMEAQGFITRRRSQQDERKVIIQLTEHGAALQSQAASIPQDLLSQLHSDAVTPQDLYELKEKLVELVQSLSQKQEAA